MLLESYPNEVIITDIVEDQSSDNNTPAGEQGDDFFSSWDKPTIKRPSNPPSRTGTPSNRTASPFLTPGGQNGSRPKSPAASGAETAAAPRTVTSSAAIRKSAAANSAAAGARKTGAVLGAKRGKLGAKKVAVADDLDFDAAEKKAKEEADRIAKLGYNPDDEEEAAAHAAKEAAASKSKMPSMLDVGGPAGIISPSPVSPGARSSTLDKSGQDMERLGMGVSRLGFGQTVSVKKPATATRTGGFGQVSRATTDDGKFLIVIICSYV
jgi:ADP-ribosylation factor GTPase-activating protein 2/3